jgi:hypothetical protein
LTRQESLPAGFTYVESSLPDSQVRPDSDDSQKIHFVLVESGDSPFTYTVTVGGRWRRAGGCHHHG